MREGKKRIARDHGWQDAGDITWHLEIDEMLWTQEKRVP